MEAFLAKDPALKDTAQRAFVAYAKSVFLMKNKKIFNIQALDTDSFANSLGLAIPPRIRFLQRLTASQAKKSTENPRKVAVAAPKNTISKKTYFDENNDDSDSSTAAPADNDDEEDDAKDTDEHVFTTTTNEFDNNQQSNPFHVSDDSDSDDGVLKVKRRDHDIQLPTDLEMEENSRGRNGKKKPVTKAALAKKLLKKNIVANKKVMFDDDGDVVTVGTKDKKSELAQQYENEDEGGIDFEKARLVLLEEDKFDKQMFKEKVKAKHKEEKRKLKEQKKQEAEDQEKDEFGEDESDYEPDLSWMPDPDKIYGEKDEDDEEDGTDTSVIVEEK